MEPKPPIPFRARKKTLKKQTRPAAHRPASPRATGADDVWTYWRQFVRTPFPRAGRYPWSERMLWGNALIAGILAAGASAAWDGFAPMLWITRFLNAFFLFFLFYYVYPWVADWVMVRLFPSRMAYVDWLKDSVIRLSGWLVLAAIGQFVPLYVVPTFLWVMFGILLAADWMRSMRQKPWQVAVATAAGWLSVLLLNYILSTL